LPGLFYWLWQNAAVSVETDRLISGKPTSAQEEQFERSLRPIFINTKTKGATHDKG